MEDFDFYFGLLLGDTVMRQLDNFSVALPHILNFTNDPRIFFSKQQMAGTTQMT